MVEQDEDNQTAAIILHKEMDSEVVGAVDEIDEDVVRTEEVEARGVVQRPWLPTRSGVKTRDRVKGSVMHVVGEATLHAIALHDSTTLHKPSEDAGAEDVVAVVPRQDEAVVDHGTLHWSGDLPPMRQVVTMSRHHLSTRFIPTLRPQGRETNCAPLWPVQTAGAAGSEPSGPQGRGSWRWIRRKNRRAGQDLCHAEKAVAP